MRSRAGCPVHERVTLGAVGVFERQSADGDGARPVDPRGVQRLRRIGLSGLTDFGSEPHPAAGVGRRGLAGLRDAVEVTAQGEVGGALAPELDEDGQPRVAAEDRSRNHEDTGRFPEAAAEVHECPGRSAVPLDRGAPQPGLLVHVRLEPAARCVRQRNGRGDPPVDLERKRAEVHRCGQRFLAAGGDLDEHVRPFGLLGPPRQLAHRRLFAQPEPVLFLLPHRVFVRLDDRRAVAVHQHAAAIDPDHAVAHVHGRVDVVGHQQQRRALACRTARGCARSSCARSRHRRRPALRRAPGDRA